MFDYNNKCIHGTATSSSSSMSIDQSPWRRGGLLRVIRWSNRGQRPINDYQILYCKIWRINTFIKYLVTFKHCALFYWLILRLCRILRWGYGSMKLIKLPLDSADKGLMKKWWRLAPQVLLGLCCPAGCAAAASFFLSTPLFFSCGLQLEARKHFSSIKATLLYKPLKKYLGRHTENSSSFTDTIREHFWLEISKESRRIKACFN